MSDFRKSIEDEPEFQKMLFCPQDKSIFRHLLFTGMVEMAHIEGHRFKFDYSDSDLIGFMNYGAKNITGLTTVGVVFGIGEDGTHHDISCDPVTSQLIKVNYYLAANPNHKTYFLDDEITSMLEATNLEWMDLKIFEDLPDVFTLKVPTGHIKMKTLGEEFWLEDLILARVKTPIARRLMLKQHGLTDDADTHLFYWLASSRDEINKGINNTTFGTFKISADMRLENMMESMSEWAEHQAQHLMETVSPELIASLEREGAAKALRAYLAGNRVEAEMFDHSIAYVKGILNPEEIRGEIQRNRMTLEFLFKFVMLQGSEQFKGLTVDKAPPGVRPGKLSPKAAKIQARLRKDWGVRCFVHAPKINEEERQSPVRHHVQGFFRRQAYGHQRSMRKVIWINPFWRGAKIV